MGNEAEREEYCMEENGLIFAGSWNKIVKMHWTFGQFEKDILDITFRLFICSYFAVFFYPNL